jgi:hypothetical protein
MQAWLSMRRLAAVTLIVFVLVLALLAGRVRAGADPTQTGAPVSSTATPSPSPDSGFSPPGYGAPGDTVDPYGGGAGSVVPDADPPVTHAS